ncbi:family 20 glycosylhydrolase [Microbacterium sp. NPDC057659]|uniref:family 20 glycosylhydrolase n=1 Tax=Microbacterium sp. NPDC057659 TaxID=3346198 RepID=UPI00366E581C
MALPDSLPLVPYPSDVRREEGVFPLASARIAGDSVIAGQLRDGVVTRTGIRSQVVGEGTDAEIVLSLDPSAGGAEAYILDSLGSSIRVTGADAAGLFYGTRTLLQLLHESDAGWAVPRVRIEDAPRFAYRGVMLDVARHFFGVEDVKSYIDRAVDLKYNHLHLHLTDDQGWRLEIDAWPLLTERASGSDTTGGTGGFFTKDQYREILAYAADRHVTVVPEIDLPGHTHAVGIAYPDLVEEPWLSEQSIAEQAALGIPLPVHGEFYRGAAVGHSSVRIHEERTYDFITDVLREVAEITPGPYLHIGGDECLGTPAADFALFFERVSRIAADTGKTPVAWHEAGAVAGIAEGTIGQYWGSVEPKGSHAAEATHFVERGGALIMSPSDRTYLDMKPTPDFPLGLVWAGIVPVRTAYEWEPTAVVPGLADDAILGVEAPLWTETVTTIAAADTLVFPRIAAHAETAWSPKEGTERTWESFRTRVAGLAPAWEASGIEFTRSEEIAWA